ncbi:helix-turn-helix domain-containing protein [Micromonospora sp. CPCC 205371]|nr:helix-turn-helix domain-containing protein [Micromonospora sp. CPCC 205371]
MPTKREQFTQTIRAQYLGQQMRELRDAHGKTLKFVSAYLGVEFSTLARYERAEWPFQLHHVGPLLDVYGVYDEADRRQLNGLAANAWRADIWYRSWAKPDPMQGPVPDRWWVHQRAQKICVYSPTIVPELLQTEAYAEQIFTDSHTGPSREEQWRKHRHGLTERTKAITANPDGPSLHVVLDENVLRKPIGGPKVLEAQLERLVELGRHANVDIQILTNHTRLPAGITAGFTVYQMPMPYPPVARIDHLGGTLLIETDGAQRYSDAFDTLTKTAEPADQSIGLIKVLKAEIQP